MSESDGHLTILARRLFDGIADTARYDVAIRIAGANIAGVGQQNGFDENAGRMIEVDTVAPGFIDLQINGANDVQFNDDPTVDAILQIQQGARKGGTACLLPTFVTAPGQDYLKALSAVGDRDCQRGRRASWVSILRVLSCPRNGRVLHPKTLHPSHG